MTNTDLKLKDAMHELQQKKRQVFIIKWGTGALLLILLIAAIIFFINDRPETITLIPENLTITQGEALPALKAIVSYEGKHGARRLDKSGKLTLTKLVKELKNGQHYTLTTSADTNIDNTYPLTIKLDPDFAKKLKKEYKHKLHLQVDEGQLVVKNRRGTWDGTDRFRQTDGSYLTGDFLESGGKTYYFDQDGRKVTEKTQIGLKMVSFDKNGVMTGRDDKLLIDPQKPLLALTFDDGPGVRTGELVALLDKYNVHATFFAQGKQVAAHPEAAAAIVKAGSELANHSYNHPDLAKLPAAKIKEQINSTNDAIYKATGQKAAFLRPPYGSINATVRANVGLPMVLWSVDTLDWKTKNVEANIKAALNGAGDGQIILMHDIHDTSVDSIYTIIPELLKKGYQLVTVSELAQAKGLTLKAGQAYGSLK